MNCSTISCSFVAMRCTFKPGTLFVEVAVCTVHYAVCTIGCTFVNFSISHVGRPTKYGTWSLPHGTVRFAFNHALHCYFTQLLYQGEPLWL